MKLLCTLDQTIGWTSLAQLSAQVGTAVRQAEAGGKEIVNHAFWKTVLLVAAERISESKDDSVAAPVSLAGG